MVWRNHAEISSRRRDGADTGRLERWLRRLADLQLELSNAALALAEQHARHHDELVELADALREGGTDDARASLADAVA